MNFDSGRILQHLVQNQCKRTFVLNLTSQTSFVGWQSHHGLQMRWMCLNAAFYHKNPSCFTGIYPWIHITAQLKHRYITLTLNPPPSPPQTKFWATQTFWAAREIWAKPVFYVSASYDPPFFSTVFQKFGQLARIFWANGLPPPLAKNCPNIYVDKN